MNDDRDLDRLAARAQSGDAHAFEILVRRLVRPALAAAWEFVRTREDAEDVVQEAFARAWRQLTRYDTARAFAPWFFTLLRNVARNASRFDRTWNLVSLTNDLVAKEEFAACDDHDGGMSSDIAAALDALSPMQRACFRLTEMEGFSSRDTAAMLGVSDATVRVHAHRARKTLRARLANDRTAEQA
jgi:RNA polymerase sigma-70 factor (ECF subfamily)